MKHILTLLLLAFSAIVRAADLYVEENGASGAYITIAAAVAASSAGDRILVFPRSANASYGGFTYTGGGLQILSAVEGQRYRVSSDINFGALSGQVHISNMYCGTNCSISTTAACSAPTITRFTDCYFDTATFYFHAFDNHLLYLQHDTLISSPVYSSHLTITGSYIENSLLWKDPQQFSSSGVAPGNDTVTMIGNFYNYTTLANSYPPLNWYGISNSCYISNNYFRINCAHYAWLYFYCTDFSGTKSTNFNNNTIVYLSSSFAYGFSYPYLYAYGKNMVNNNVAITSGNFPYAIYSTGQAEYNYTNSSDPYAIYLPGGTNVLGAAITYDINTGAVTSGPAVNGGSPKAEFTDIDLTRNDAGCYGGSFSRANFDNADNGSRVLMVNTPRRAVKGNAFTITGDGLDK